MCENVFVLQRMCNTPYNPYNLKIKSTLNMKISSLILRLKSNQFNVSNSQVGFNNWDSISWLLELGYPHGQSLLWLVKVLKIQMKMWQIYVQIVGSLAEPKLVVWPRLAIPGPVRCLCSCWQESNIIFHSKTSPDHQMVLFRYKWVYLWQILEGIIF